ncbi:metallophosphoesterase [Haloquadratum walsbyi]|jgi:Predicted ICC-like phosphoesterases|uniref:Putative ICC-like phosphoesterase n=1 Tax=Haloquadratum walsbyi J07HQW2 TaxID=1238425 RepID=U1NI48_9EURY|nr:metallophosphoesterase [Haloquadratum walsbyi]ERG96573.1 MAG: putative ICC-like phosphoesterase [Haloquadratum walsbyi J07HQW2]
MYVTDTDLIYRSRALWVPDAATLVISDLHIGRDEASNVQLPLGERDDLLQRVQTHLKEVTPETVVVAGDIFHRFDTVTSSSRKTLAALIDTCVDTGAECIFVRGNHDTGLESTHNTTVVDSYTLEGLTTNSPQTVICHGHTEPTTTAERYIIGHDHPAITIEGKRHPCFLSVPNSYQNADIIMLPAFSRLAAGVSINAASGSDLQSPLITQLEHARPTIYDNQAAESLSFPPLQSFRTML